MEEKEFIKIHTDKKHRKPALGVIVKPNETTDEKEQLYTIIPRHDTSTNWAVNDPILALGEYGIEDDTHRVKRGNGFRKWSELGYEDFGISLNVKLEDNQTVMDLIDSKLPTETFEKSMTELNTNLNETVNELQKSIDEKPSIEEVKTIVDENFKITNIHYLYCEEVLDTTTGKISKVPTDKISYLDTNEEEQSVIERLLADQRTSNFIVVDSNKTLASFIVNSIDEEQQTLEVMTIIAYSKLEAVDSNDVLVGESTLTDTLNEIDKNLLKREIVKNKEEMTDLGILYLLPKTEGAETDLEYDKFIVVEQEDGSTKLERLNEDANLTDYVKDEDIQTVSNTEIDNIFNI